MKTKKRLKNETQSCYFFFKDNLALLNKNPSGKMS